MQSAQVAAPTDGLKPGGEFCGLCTAAQSDGQMQPHLEMVLDAASGHHTTPVNGYHRSPHVQMCDDGSDPCPHMQPVPCHQPRHSSAVLPAVTAWLPQMPAAAEVLAVAPAHQPHLNAGWSCLFSGDNAAEAVAMDLSRAI